MTRGALSGPSVRCNCGWGDGPAMRKRRRATVMGGMDVGADGRYARGGERMRGVAKAGGAGSGVDIARSLRRSLAELVGLVFPARCGGCGRVVPAGEGLLCATCGSAVLAVADTTYCQLCGQDAGPFALHATDHAGVRACGLCDRSLYRYAALSRVGPYAPPLDGLIRRFKYAGGQHLAGALGEWQAARLAGQGWFARVEGLVAVPMHWRRRFARGFNQSELLAEVVAERLELPILDSLTRPVHRPPQASLPRSQRFENVRGVFAVPRAKQVRNRRLCLIDDVCTTGATLSEAARTLRSAGTAEVYAAVVAVAQPPPAFSDLLREP